MKRAEAEKPRLRSQEGLGTRAPELLAPGLARDLLLGHAPLDHASCRTSLTGRLLPGAEPPLSSRLSPKVTGDQTWAMQREAASTPSKTVG